MPSQTAFVVTSIAVSGWSFPIAAFSAKRTVAAPPQSTPVSAWPGASWSMPLKRGRQRYTVTLAELGLGCGFVRLTDGEGHGQKLRVRGEITTPLVCQNARPRLDSFLMDDSFISPRALSPASRSLAKRTRHFEAVRVAGVPCYQRFMATSVPAPAVGWRSCVAIGYIR